MARDATLDLMAGKPLTWLQHEMWKWLQRTDWVYRRVDAGYYGREMRYIEVLMESQA